MSKLLLAFVSALAVGATGCQTYRAPGSLLPSMAAARQDRTIEEYAASSSFPSPADVGLTEANANHE